MSKKAKLHILLEEVENEHYSGEVAIRGNDEAVVDLLVNAMLTNEEFGELVMHATQHYMEEKGFLDEDPDTGEEVEKKEYGSN